MVTVNLAVGLVDAPREAIVSKRSLRCSRRLRPIVAGGAAAVAAVAVAACGSGGSSGSGASGSPTSGTVTVAVVANPQMQQMEQLTRSVFEKKYPKIQVKFDTLNENTERSNIEKDMSTGAGLYDVVMISNYETPFYAKGGLLVDLSKKFFPKDPSYDPADFVKPIRESLSYQGDMYSVPFYGESSMLYYRKSMLKAAGITMPSHPTWSQVAADAAKLNKPGKVAGICLRGQEGWGENLAPLDTVINTYGGEWFNQKWKPQLTSPATERAINFYVNLIRKDGESGASQDGFTQLLTAYSQGQCAMWYDATVAAPTIAGTVPKIFSDTGYAYAPTVKKPNSGWLYSWSLGIPKNSKNQAAAWTFVNWATSKNYIQTVGKKLGWSQLPPGSRTSTYSIPQYKKAAGAYAGITLSSIQDATPKHPTVNPVPYTGVQFVDIPQFQSFGTTVSKQIAGAIAGSEPVSMAISTSQAAAASAGAGQS